MQAYAFAVENHGMDIHASWLWIEYVALARDFQTDNPWEQVKELDNARKLYRRALDVPMQDLDTIWRDYEKFEKDWNKQTAEQALMKARERYANSKRCLRERNLLWGKCETRMLARPPTTVQNKTGAEVTVAQLSAWRNLIAPYPCAPRYRGDNSQHRVARPCSVGGDALC
eukprot:SAG31_NODE_5225_length_2664_cov_1.819493_2_plen_171_part_00